MLHFMKTNLFTRHKLTSNGRGAISLFHFKSILNHALLFPLTASSVVAWRHGQKTAGSIQQEEEEEGEGKERKEIGKEEGKEEVEYQNGNTVFLITCWATSSNKTLIRNKEQGSYYLTM